MQFTVVDTKMKKVGSVDLRDDLFELREIKLFPVVREDTRAELHHNAGDTFKQFRAHGAKLEEKLQIPSSKLQRNSKFQSLELPRAAWSLICLAFDVWCLEFICSPVAAGHLNEL